MKKIALFIVFTFLFFSCSKTDSWEDKESSLQFSLTQEMQNDVFIMSDFLFAKTETHFVFYGESNICDRIEIGFVQDEDGEVLVGKKSIGSFDYENYHIVVHKDNVAHKVVEGEIYISYAGGYYDFTFDGELASGERIVGEAQSLWPREEKEIPPYFLYRNESEFVLKIEGEYPVDTTFIYSPLEFSTIQTLRSYKDEEGNDVEYYHTFFIGAVNGVAHAGIQFPFPYEIENPGELQSATYALDCSLGNIVVSEPNTSNNWPNNYNRLAFNMAYYSLDIPRHLSLFIPIACPEDEIENRTQELFITIEGVSQEYQTFNVTIEGNADGALRDPYAPNSPITDRIENIPFYLEYKNIKIEECL